MASALRRGCGVRHRGGSRGVVEGVFEVERVTGKRIYDGLEQDGLERDGLELESFGAGVPEADVYVWIDIYIYISSALVLFSPYFDGYHQSNLLIYTFTRVDEENMTPIPMDHVIGSKIRIT